MSYIETIKKIKETFEADRLVNTIVTDDSGIDTYKKNIFPLVHFQATASPFLTNTRATTRYSFEITIVDVRDFNKEEVNDKFWRNDNLHDNLNTLRSILKNAENKMRELDDVKLINATDANPVIFDFQNVLDGWQQTWTFDTDDDLLNACIS